MQTLALGRCSRAQRGFTLLEMLVVLAIMGTTAALMGVGLGASPQRQALEHDAETLAQLFMVAQVQARHRTTPIVWRHDENGYGFEHMLNAHYLPDALAHDVYLNSRASFDQTSALRARSWQSATPVNVRVYPAARVVFKKEWLSGPDRVELDNGVARVRLVRTAGGQYLVQK